MKTPSMAPRAIALSCAHSLAFFGIASSAVAQTQQTPIALERITVTASRVPTPLADVMADVTVIERDQLDQAGQSSLKDLLGQQPGVQFATNGSYRSATGIFLRGASTSQTIVLVDGVRVGSATSGGAPFENMPLERIERIEILRGAASALYGPDAVGGVIQIFTRAPSMGLSMAAKAGFGSDGQQTLGASLRGTQGVVGYSLGVSREKASGISAIVNPAAGSFNADSDGFVSTSIDAKLTANINREHGLSASVLRSQSRYEFDGTPFPNPLGLNKSTSDAVAKPRLGHVSLRWDAQWLAQWKSSLTVGSSNDDSVSEYFRFSDRALGGSSTFNTRRKQTTWQNDVQMGKNLLTVVLEQRSEAVDSSTLYTVNSRDVRSAMLSYAVNRSDWSALIVARNDTNSQFGSFNNWALSGGYKLADGLRAVASVGTSFQAPSFNQLYFPGFGNAALAPQRNRSEELGLRYNRGHLSLGAVVYRNDIQGFILPSSNAQSARAVLSGATLSANATIGVSSLAVSYDYADPRSYSATAASNNLRLVRVARNVANVRVTHPVGHAIYFGEIKLSSNREDNNLNFNGRDTLAGYGLLNLGADWRIRNDLSVLVRLNNAANAQYQLANTYSSPGRNVFASLAWSM